MTMIQTTQWTAVCDVARLTTDRGVAALVDGTAVAVFALANGGGVLGDSARGVVVVGFLGLAIVCGALALLRDRSQLA